MKDRRLEDLSNLSMHELFRVEAENQAAILTNGLLELERGGAAPQQLETLMRAAHSLKGAARIIDNELIVRLAHSMEDCFVAAQQGTLILGSRDTDLLLGGVDLLSSLARLQQGETAKWEGANAGRISHVLESLTQITQLPRDGGSETVSRPARPERSMSVAGVSPGSGREITVPPVPSRAEPEVATMREAESAERVVRLTARNLNRLLGLAGESLVESRWLRPFADSLQRLKRQHADLTEELEQLRRTAAEDNLSESVRTHIHELLHKVADCQEFLSVRMEELDTFDRRSAHLSHRLYLEVLRTRMRPFADGVRRFPRMVRDLARSLGKEVRLEIIGETTQVDRDILERLETPLAHLLRNAVDHGCEQAAERLRAGKERECVIRLEARHSAGMLLVTVADDGMGVEPERVRHVVVQKKLTAPDVAQKLGEAELLEFLFLPGFTMKEMVTEISGRGVGLDVVQNMVKGVRGSIRLNTQAGRGLRVQLQLPLTLSVLRALLVEVGGEPYAIPLTQITRALKLPRKNVATVEGRHHFQFADQPVGLLAAQHVFDSGACGPAGADLSVVVLGERNTRYGLVVDRFLGERELVVQALDPRLGKVKDISAAALMEDGAPVLIVDVEDLLRSIENLVSGGRLAEIHSNGLDFGSRRQKRILAVDDSLTVRELERKLLTSRGYLADVAVDGMDAWNAVRAGQFDLVLTDVDMPRMDGIELATLIKKDARLKSTPVMIVSYKDREEDRLRGLEAGADYYLTKGSFHDETLIQAVVDLIGEPEA